MSWLPRNRVVVPLDFGDESLKPLEVAMSFVAEPSDVTVLHVLPRLSTMEPGVAWGSMTDETRIARATEEVQKRLMNYEGLGIVVRIGQPAKVIAQYAEEVEAGLIVVSSHGHSRAHDIFLGSTVDGLLHQTTRPVLVLRHG